jgi:hypothetical protein
MTEAMREIPSRFTLVRQRTIGLGDLCTHHLARKTGRPLFVGDAKQSFQKPSPRKSGDGLPGFWKKLCENKEM